VGDGARARGKSRDSIWGASGLRNSPGCGPPWWHTRQWATAGGGVARWLLAMPKGSPSFMEVRRCMQGSRRGWTWPKTTG
jgi:hypothetical protein